VALERHARLGPPQSPANWRDLAVCTQVDPDVFFATRDPDLTRAAKAICQGCPVRDECLKTALADPSLTGIWGGTAADERTGMRGAHA
jgi:WhiB family redox-sensing transcriptional regulator